MIAKIYPLVSVIIPTHNRSLVIEKSLPAFLDQNYLKNKTEIIVIDDWSTDDTKSVVRSIINKKHGIAGLSYLYQSGRGPASARNLGIKSCRGEIVLIVNDDTIPSKDLISQHVNFHLKHPGENYAVLGYFTWSPEIKITPFMRWLENGGPAFSYNQIKGKRLSWAQAWSCNLSYKREFLLKNGLFDEDFHYAAWEDIELSYRLSQHGLKLLYNRNAVGYHYHPTTLESSLAKMVTHGFGGSVFKEKVKDQSVLTYLYRDGVGDLINFLDRIIFIPPIIFLLKRLALFGENKFVCHYPYTYLLLHYRVLGRRQYLKEKQC